jgi:CRP/FNR family cyclic AMP-dependent transcriptional regulator
VEFSTIELLRRVPLFEGLEEESIRALAEHSRRRKFRGGEALFHEGDPGQTLYLIAGGHVNIQTSASDGQTVHVAYRGPGEHFGEMALIDGKPRMADAVTAESCDLIMLDRIEFIACLERSPKIALSVMASLAERLRQAAQSLRGRQGLDVNGRLSAMLLQLVRENSSPVPGGRRIETKMTQQEMADRIGATRETVNRALSSLCEVRAIRMAGRQIIVLDQDRLRRYCDDLDG